MATVRSIYESRVIQLSIFSDTRSARVYAFLDVDSSRKSVNKFGQFNFFVCCNLQDPILPVLILKPNSCPSFQSIYSATKLNLKTRARNKTSRESHLTPFFSKRLHQRGNPNFA